MCMLAGIDVEDVELLDLNTKNDSKGLEVVEQDGKVFVTKARVEIADWVEHFDDSCTDQYYRNQAVFLNYNQKAHVHFRLLKRHSKMVAVYTSHS